MDHCYVIYMNFRTEDDYDHEVVDVVLADCVEDVEEHMRTLPQHRGAIYGFEKIALKNIRP